MSYCYILHSTKLNRYYIGSTELDPKDRLDLHLQKAYENNKFTAKTDDWVMVLSFKCNSLTQARKIENFIKRMKSKKYIQDVITDENRIKWLLENI